MEKEGKTRIIAFIIISIILSYFAIGYVYELYQSDINSVMVNTDEIKDINIDGSDFTPVFKLFGGGLNGFILLITVGIDSVVILVVGLILSISFRVIGLNKNRCIGQEEYKIVKYAYIIILSISFLTGGISTRFSLIIPLILFNAIWGGLVFGFCVMPLRSRIKKNVHSTFRR